MPRTLSGTLTGPPVTLIVTCLGGPVDDWAFTTFGTSPAALMSLIAFLVDSPTTDGTVASDGPLDSTILTTLPLGFWLPKPGMVLMTRPFLTVVLGCCVTEPTVKPAALRLCSAVASGWPATPGTATPLLLPPTYFSSTMAAISTATTTARTTQGQARLRRCGGPPRPSSSGPYRYGGIAAVRPASCVAAAPMRRVPWL